MSGITFRNIVPLSVRKFRKHTIRWSRRPFMVLLLFLLMLSILLTQAACGSVSDHPVDGTEDTTEESAGKDTTGKDTKPHTATTSSPSDPNHATKPGTQAVVGLTSVQASKLVWSKADGNLPDAVLWRMIPVVDKDSTEMKLDPGWLENDISGAWFIWYADPNGENWMMFGIEGKKCISTDIGTRGFGAIAMGSDWPRESVTVTMKDAAAAAAAQGVDMKAVTWVEYSCEYADINAGLGPAWAFSISETTQDNITLNYRIFVDALTGDVIKAVNDNNEEMALPINLGDMTTEKTDTHQTDLQKFFDFITSGTEENMMWAVRQLSYNMSPDEATAQVWLANFKTLTSLKVISIEQANLVQWTAQAEYYKVTLDITTSEPVETYGWENGDNVRWIKIIPEGAGDWKIDSISSSP